MLVSAVPIHYNRKFKRSLHSWSSNEANFWIEIITMKAKSNIHICFRFRPQKAFKQCLSWLCERIFFKSHSSHQRASVSFYKGFHGISKRLEIVGSRRVAFGFVLHHILGTKDDGYWLTYSWKTALTCLDKQNLSRSNTCTKYRSTSQRRRSRSRIWISFFSCVPTHRTCIPSNDKLHILS